MPGEEDESSDGLAKPGGGEDLLNFKCLENKRKMVFLACTIKKIKSGNNDDQ